MDKNKYLKRITISILIGMIAVCGISVFVIMFPRNVYHESYQSLIQDKYEALINTNSPKIIIVGGSSACFGVDNKMLEEATGYPVVNLGLHAGFGALFNTELSKANINSGDIVLVAYEYGWPKEDYFDDFGVDIVMSGIDNNLSIYKYVPLRKIPSVIGFIPEYAKNKANYSGDSGTYSRESFDENGNLVLERELSYEMQYYDPETWVSVKLEDADISDKSCRYIKEYKAYVEDRGASIYMIGCPLYEKAYVGEADTLDMLVKNEESEIGIKYISNPKNYLFEADDIFDTIYHCSSKGQKKRTELLIKDLSEAGVINAN